MGSYFCTFQLRKVIVVVRDSELDQLKSAMDAAFERMNAARNAMDLSWSRRSNLCDQMNTAYERLSPLRNRMEQTWQDLQDARDRQQRIWESMDHGGSSEYERLTELINEAKSNADAAYANAQDAFQDSRSAYDSHDGAAAKEYSEGLIAIWTSVMGIRRISALR